MDRFNIFLAEDVYIQTRIGYRFNLSCHIILLEFVFTVRGSFLFDFFFQKRKAGMPKASMNKPIIDFPGWAKTVLKKTAMLNVNIRLIIQVMIVDIR